MADKPETSLKEDLTKSLSDLSLNTSTKAPQKAVKKKKAVVADSWEDEDDSDSGSEDVGATAATSAKESPSVGTNAPPPTPISPTHVSGSQYQDSWPSPSSSQADLGPRRPEKTDAVARRMIAASLGLKAPKQTEEQKAYQNSIREQERKRREEEKAEGQRQKEKAEQAKAAIWDN